MTGSAGSGDVTPEALLVSGALAVQDWQRFAAPRFRTYHYLAMAQGVVGVLAGFDVVIPFALAIGTPPFVAVLLGVLPLAGGMAQLLVPRLLDRTDGNLRGLTILDRRARRAARAVSRPARDRLRRRSRHRTVASSCSLAIVVGFGQRARTRSPRRQPAVVALGGPARRGTTPGRPAPDGRLAGIGALLLLPMAVRCSTRWSTPSASTRT